MYVMETKNNKNGVRVGENALKSKWYRLIKIDSTYL